MLSAVEFQTLDILTQLMMVSKRAVLNYINS